MLDGIQEAHNYGIIHRDIKPANMMLTEKGTLKVLDFGIARILGTARMTRQGNIIGTIEYMSPEQVRGFETDARSDIYSLGMLLYEMLTARCPFEIQNEFELMKAQIEQYPVPPRQLNPAIPEVVEQAIWRSIQKDPAQRFQSASEFRAFLLNAGFAATGRIEPLAVGDPNAFGTRPVTQTPSGNPASPYATVPMQSYTPPSQPGISAPSQPGTTPPPQTGAQVPPGFTSPSHPGVGAPQQANTQTSQPGLSSPSNPGVPPTPMSNPGIAMNPTLVDAPTTNTNEAKETRIGTPASFTPAPPQGGRDAMKETRVGVGPLAGAAAVTPQGFAQAPPYAQQQRPAQQPSKGKSKLIYFVGAGAAALVVLVLVIGVGAYVLISRSKKAEPVKPAALTDQQQKPAQQPTTEPTQTTTTSPSSPDQTTVGTQTTDTTVIPVQQQPTVSEPRTTAEAPTQSGSRQAAAHAPAQQPRPQPQQPAKSNDQKSKRQRALDALDQ